MVAWAFNALYELKKYLYREYQILVTNEEWIDSNRKAIITTNKKDRFYVLFKRDFFHSYGEITKRGGIGESINIADFEYVVYGRDIEQLIYVYPNNAIYKIRTRDIKPNAFIYDNEADGKEQYLFPVKMLQKL